MDIREKALNFATEAHKGQKRKDGKDYITHPIAVAEIALNLAKELGMWEMFLDDVYIVGILHDVAEDTSVSLIDIEREFGEKIAKDVERLTKRSGENYFDFIIRISDSVNIIPMIVKVADLRHNMSDLNEGSMKDKYRFAEHHLITSIRN